MIGCAWPEASAHAAKTEALHAIFATVEAGGRPASMPWHSKTAPASAEDCDYFSLGVENCPLTTATKLNALTD